MTYPYPVFCALDLTELDAARELADRLHGHVDGIKLGLEFFCANGPAGIAAMGEAGLPIFLDLKLHDIPNTVAKAIRALKGLPVVLLTVHAGGGSAMMQAAREACETLSWNGRRPSIVGVTALTSMEDADLAETGIADGTEAHVARLAGLAQASGLDGIVCSPLETARMRRSHGPDFLLVVPGIRPAGSEPGDQKRIMTPAEAMQAGASCLVIGRPITAAENPAEAAGRIRRELFAA